VPFNSPVFAIFFIGYVILHGLTPERFRLWTMIAGSAVFYGYWNWTYAGLPFGLVLVTHLATCWTVSMPPDQRRLRLVVSIVALLMPLMVFKYANFIWRDVLGAAGSSLPDRLVTVGLPLGISFITFTAIAYLIDVTTGRYPIERAPRWLVGHTVFFPHLIAGPILRPHELIPQIRGGMALRRHNLWPGLALFSAGLLKKMLFADPIGEVVADIYERPAARGIAEYLFAFYGFAAQIYCDFSGYTDMATGTALILGVRLPGNFARPYLATSIAEFWRRWHITLSGWLRRYIYIPLGGSRGDASRTARNVLVTIAVGGLWHGASWTFLIWGVLHGLAVAGSILLRRPTAETPRAPDWLRILLTFHAVALLWVVFRAPDLGTTLTMLKGCLGGASAGNAAEFVTGHLFEIALVLTVFVIHPWDDPRRIRIAAKILPPAVVGSVVLIALVLAVAVGARTSSEFIYFEF
jgi:alginate O-acetyltransferase complex protein AlgI